MAPLQRRPMRDLQFTSEITMATIRKLRGRWQAQVRRRGVKPRCKSFDSKLEAEKWARELEAQVDRFGAACTRALEARAEADPSSSVPRDPTSPGLWKSRSISKSGCRYLSIVCQTFLSIGLSTFADCRSSGSSGTT